MRGGRRDGGGVSRPPAEFLGDAAGQVAELLALDEVDDRLAVQLDLHCRARLAGGQRPLEGPGGLCGEPHLGFRVEFLQFLDELADNELPELHKVPPGGSLEQAEPPPAVGGPAIPSWAPSREVGARMVRLALPGWSRRAAAARRAGEGALVRRCRRSLSSAAVP